MDRLSKPFPPSYTLGEIFHRVFCIACNHPTTKMNEFQRANWEDAAKAAIDTGMAENACLAFHQHASNITTYSSWYNQFGKIKAIEMKTAWETAVDYLTEFYSPDPILH